VKSMRVSLALAFCLSMPSFAAVADQRVAKGISSLPMEARASISAAVGRDNADYQVHARNGGFSLQTAKHGLTADFTAAGVEVGSGAAHWRMVLRGYGYGDAMTIARVAVPHATSNRVEYRRDALTEWYVNGPMGLEQGFTINERPGKANGQPLTIALALSGNLNASVDSSSSGLTLADREERAELRYLGLAAYDASGKKLQAWLEVRGQELLLKADDAKARYPVVIDPWMQLAELTASDATPYSFLGDTVAMSGDTVVVGADNEGSQNQGAAYVFVKPKSGWKTTSKFTAKLTARDQQSEGLFGTSVSISGSVIVIGAANEAIGQNQGQGAAYIYVKPKSGWKTTSRFTAKLTSSDGATSDRFGSSVSLDGSTLVIGAPNASVNGNQGQGTGYVFIKPPGGWKSGAQTAKLTSSDGESSDFFGSAASVSADTIAVGAYGHNQQQGGAYVFVKPPGGWSSMSQSAKLTASDGHPGDEIGVDVSIDGNTVAVGARFAVVHGQQQGAAYIFLEPTGGWKGSIKQTAKLTASDGEAGDWFGQSVSLSRATMAIGALGVNRNRGAAYVFTKPISGWKNSSRFSAKLAASNGHENDQLGFSVAIQGNTVVSGAPYFVVNNASVGAVYVFSK
jgi:hypothetical protein